MFYVRVSVFLHTEIRINRFSVFGDENNKSTLAKINFLNLFLFSLLYETKNKHIVFTYLQFCNEIIGNTSLNQPRF